MGTRHAFLSITCLSIKALSWSGQSLSRGPESWAPKAPNHPQRKPPFGTVSERLLRGILPGCPEAGGGHVQKVLLKLFVLIFWPPALALPGRTQIRPPIYNV